MAKGKKAINLMKFDVVEELKLRKFDPVNYLKSEMDMALYLEACFEEGGDDPAFIAAALGDIARAMGISNMAAITGLTRPGLYKALSKDGNPSFGVVLKVIRAMGLQLHVRPHPDEAPDLSTPEWQAKFEAVIKKQRGQPKAVRKPAKRAA